MRPFITRNKANTGALNSQGKHDTSKLLNTLLMTLLMVKVNATNHSFCSQNSATKIMETFHKSINFNKTIVRKMEGRHRRSGRPSGIEKQ